MKLQNYFVTAAFLLLLVGSVSAAPTDSKNLAQAARQTVETYCKIEFEGALVEDRWALLKFSAKRKGENEYRDIPDAAFGVFQLGDGYPFIVVAAYDIGEVRVLSPTRATAQVTYRRLAHSEGPGRWWQLIAEPAHDETVTLNLVFDKKKWWIFDPPAPRLSKQPMLKYYESQVKEYSSRWEQELNDPSYDEELKANTRTYQDHFTSALKILKELP